MLGCYILMSASDVMLNTASMNAVQQCRSIPSWCPLLAPPFQGQAAFGNP